MQGIKGKKRKRKYVIIITPKFAPMVRASKLPRPTVLATKPQGWNVDIYQLVFDDLVKYLVFCDTQLEKLLSNVKFSLLYFQP